MRCTSCGQEFEPTAELKRLILTGNVSQVCDTCERPAPKPQAKKQFGGPVKRTPIAVLYRIDKFNADGIVTNKMALPPKAIRQKARTRRPGRRDDRLHAFVISASEAPGAHTPRVALISNLDTYQRTGQPLLFQKIPGYYCPLTGQDRMEVFPTDIDRVEDDGGLEVNIVLKDNSRLRLLYRNS